MNKEETQVNLYGTSRKGTLGRRLAALLTSVVMLLMVALPAAAQGLEGEVILRVSDPSGQPVSTATVEVYALNAGLVSSAKVGADGVLRLTPPSGRSGLWQVRASAPDYRVRETGWFDPAQGGVRNIILEPLGGELQLFLRSAAGERINANVTLLTGAGRLVAQGTATGGRWVSKGLATGEYRALVSVEGLAPIERRVTVTAGRVAVEAISLAPGSISAVGEVVDATTGAPMKDALVELLRADDVVVGEAKSGVTGRFSIQASLPAGSYRLRVSAPGYSPVVTAPQTVDAGGYLDFAGPYRIRLSAATATIEGTLATIGARPIPWATMVLVREGFGEVASVKVDKEGTFRFDNVPAGTGFRYQVVAQDAIDNLTVDHIDLAISNWFTVNPGGKVQVPLVAQSFSEHPMLQATVTGTVLGPTGLPVADATVELIRRSRVERTVTTDAEGKFVMEHVEASQDGGLAQAPYMLRVSKEGFVASREVLVAGQKATTFDIPSGGRLVLEATLHPAVTELKGRVVDTLGRPVQGAKVTLALGDGSQAGSDTTDKSGWYRLGNLPTTTAWAALRIAAEGYLPSGDLDVTAVIATGDAPPTVRLAPSTTTLDGVVVDLQGRPVSDAKVRLLLDGQVAAETKAESDGYYTLKADLSSASLGLLLVEHEGYNKGGMVLSDLSAIGQHFSQALMIQQDRSVLEGRVLNPAGQPLSGVRVELVVEGGAAPKAAITGADGRYRLEQPLPDGAAWAWLRVVPASGTFAGSLTHGMDMAPIIRLTAGDRVVTDLLVRP